ncbi:TPA: hypothetical protein SHW33_003760 [Clostridioides difficile]|uniref:hypothetical protein n=2 Tax=Clostridioides difficile TaxID=1496 RepID=UPI00038D8B23|nr:hypothetical protein [Clostridioides difficile]WMU95082.1 hypothetical protein NMPPGEIJ_00043 [Clostridioides phage AR1074-1]EGT3729670.1 hypothetical protein [Clostridioides difficile]EGT3734698.1 hypothetical protein [Clostridioides difficile]EGT4537019.1 hypothetical protein [Clostridioides difficile]EGT4739802.1 hypothetical protein [Clostridioides difficile]
MNKYGKFKCNNCGKKVNVNNRDLKTKVIDNTTVTYFMCRRCFEKFVVSCEDDYIKHKREEYKKLKDDEVKLLQDMKEYSDGLGELYINEL